MARIPRQHFSKTFSARQFSSFSTQQGRFLARFLRKKRRTAGPYNSRTADLHCKFAQISRSRFEGGHTASGCTFGTHFKAEIVQQIFGQLARFSRQAVQQHLRLLFGTKIEKSVQHLLLFLFCCLHVFRGGG